MPLQLTLAGDRCTRRLFSGEVAGVRGANVGSRDINWREWLIGSSRGCRRLTQCLPYTARDVSIIGSRLKSPTTLLELCRIVPAKITAKTRSCCSQQAVAAADNMSVVSTFTLATFSPAGIHKPHAAQPDLLLLLFTDLHYVYATARRLRSTMKAVCVRWHGGGLSGGRGGWLAATVYASFSLDSLQGRVLEVLYHRSSGHPKGARVSASK